MRKKDLVAMFMESPFYFELTPRERLFLLKDHRLRFGRSSLAASDDAAAVAGETPTPVLPLPPAKPQIKRVEF